MAEITYIEDLAKELAEEHGLGYEEALEICELNVDYVYELVKDPKVTTIRFPHLGNMYFNLKRAKYAKVFKKYEKLVKDKVAKVQKMVDKSKDLAHGRTSYFTIIRKYFYPDVQDRMRVSRDEVYKKIELKQNKK
tara:strand:- start:354 stop:758 length:405 start_codon:yes stop_codon:yes gene_type:complete